LRAAIELPGLPVKPEEVPVTKRLFLLLGPASRAIGRIDQRSDEDGGRRQHQRHAGAQAPADSEARQTYAEEPGDRGEAELESGQPPQLPILRIGPTPKLARDG
jgi:hypothetical protein